MLAKMKDQYRRGNSHGELNGNPVTVRLESYCLFTKSSNFSIRKCLKVRINGRNTILFLLAQINTLPEELALTVFGPTVGLSYQNFFLLGKGKEISLIFQQLRETRIPCVINIPPA